MLLLNSLWVSTTRKNTMLQMHWFFRWCRPPSKQRNIEQEHIYFSAGCIHCFYDHILLALFFEHFIIHYFKAELRKAFPYELGIPLR